MLSNRWEDELFKRIDHIGVIVKDIKEASALFSEFFGFRKDDILPHTEPQGEFRSAFLVAGEVSIELIEPSDPNGALAYFLQKRGEGLHHISIEVDDIDQKLDSLKAKGIRLINEKAQVVGNSKVAFVHPTSSKGILIELTEKVPK
jgi:methylmalonyl-CoA epimerase